MPATVSEVAKRLGVNETRVRQLVKEGRLTAERIGRAFLIDEESVERFARSPRRPGRPAEAGTAWAALALLSGYEPRWVSPSTLSTLRSKIASVSAITDLLATSEPRASVQRWRLLPVDQQRIRNEYRFVATGISAPHVTELVPSRFEIDGYVTSAVAERVRKRFRGHPPRDLRKTNVTLRVPTHDWILKLETAPPAVVAADLLDDPSTRVARSGRHLLEQIVRDRRS